jgi:hypothetical protein
MTDREFNWDTWEWDPIERRCGRDDDHKAHAWRDEHGGRLSITITCPGVDKALPPRLCGRDDDHGTHVWSSTWGFTWECNGVDTAVPTWFQLPEPHTFTEYQAVCVGCNPFQPIPFGSRDDRERWWVDHQERSGHHIVFMMRVTRELEEIRRPAKNTEGDSHGGTDG